MAKLIAPDRKFGIVNRRIVTDDGGASCCCNNDVRLVRPCCGYIPTFAITAGVENALTQRCGDRWRFDRSPIFKRRGRNECLTFDQLIPRPQAESQGLEIVDDPDVFTCVATEVDNPIANRCYTEARDCPPCPNNCCLRSLYPKKCPTRQNPGNPNLDYVCCLYGRVADQTWYQNIRLNEEFYWSPVNAIGSNDPWCPSGCYVDLLNTRLETVITRRETMRFTQCNADHTYEVSSECLNANSFGYGSEVRRYHGFHDRTLPSCTSYRDVFFPPTDYSSDQCTNYTLAPDLPRLYRIQVRDVNGQLCWIYSTESFAGEVYCGETLSSDCTYPYASTTIRQQITYQRTVNCFGARFFLLTNTEIRHAPDADVPEGCEAIRGSLIQKTRSQIEISYSISTVQRDGCYESQCDGYSREDDGTPIFPGPQPVDPEPGALLFL